MEFRSQLSQKKFREETSPFLQIRQLLNELQIEGSWIEEYEGKMQKADSLQSMNHESERLSDKDTIIQIQQDYIENLKQPLEELKKTRSKVS